MYSNKSDVLDKVKASLFGLENANAVPTGDLLRAPMSEMKQYLCKKLLTLAYQQSFKNLFCGVRLKFI